MGCHVCRAYEAQPKLKILATCVFCILYLPRVIAVFSRRVRTFALFMTSTKGLASIGMKSFISAPTLSAISPADQAALLHTDVCAGSRFKAIADITSGTLGNIRAGQALVRSPNSAKADWRTSAERSWK